MLRKILSGIALSWIIIFGAIESRAYTPEKVVNMTSFSDRLSVQYGKMERSTAEGVTYTYRYSTLPNKYIIKLPRKDFKLNEQTFWHEFFHTLCNEYDVNLTHYKAFVHGHESVTENGDWHNKASEAFAEDGACYMMKKLYNIDITNDTNYEYAHRRFSWYIKRSGEMGDLLGKIIEEIR